MNKWICILALSCIFAVPAAADAAVLWDQPVAVLPGILAADFEAANDNLSNYVADDFTNADPWEIHTIITRKSSGYAPYSCVDSLNWMIFGDGGGAPDGYPAGGGFAPYWTLSLPPTDPSVSAVGDLLTVNIPAEGQPVLPPGTWWLVYYVEINSVTCGNHYWQTSSSMNGDIAVGHNPSGFWGVGTVWYPVTDVVVSLHDFVFRLEGEVGPCPAEFDRATSVLTIPEVDIVGLAKSYSVHLLRTADPGYVFELTHASRPSLGCDSALYNPVTGILTIYRVDLTGTLKSYQVTMSQLPGPGYYFELTNATK